MRDFSHQRNGFSALSVFKDWLTTLVNNLNPPLWQLVPVTVRVNEALEIKKY